MRLVDAAVGHETFAVIGDIHGNSWALKAVLDELESRGVAAIYDLGDSLYGPLDPAGSAALLRMCGIPSLMGNQDRLILSSPLRSSATWRFVREALSADDLDWLGSQPRTRRFSNLLLCHGTPFSDSKYLLETVDSEGQRPATIQKIWARLADTKADWVFCAHSHLPRLVRVDGTTVLSPGSVGLQTFEEDRPVPHVMAAGGPHARFAVVDCRDGQWHTVLRVIPYDWHSAALAARSHGRNDWARWLRGDLALSKASRLATAPPTYSSPGELP